MDSTQVACNEALHFFFDQIDELDLTNKNILIIQGQPSTYFNHLKGANVTVLSYCARASREWKQQSIDAQQSISGEFDVVIQFATKSESETTQHLSIALESLAETGTFIGVIHNRMGVTRYRKALQSIFSNLENLSKSKSRVFSSNKSDLLSLPKASSAPSPKEIKGSEYKTLPGVYGENAIDTGSEVLAEILRDEHWSGMGADIGCGFGYLTGEILKTKHRVKKISLYDIDHRSIEMSKLNLPDDTDIQYHWVDICHEIPTERQVHWAVMNPPFHSGSTQDFELGKSFIRQATSILRPGSPLFIVANLHLPYEETLHENFRSVVSLKEDKGFKCFKCVK